MPARELAWYDVEPQAFHDGHCEHADIAVLENSVGPACYEVARISYDGAPYYRGRAWYGNQGHTIDGEARGTIRHATAAAARAACQAHYDRLVDENAR